VKLKRKINLTKGLKTFKKIKRIRNKLKKKMTYHKLRLNDEIENKSKFYKKIKNIN
jgi:hypothetical protein